MASDDSDVATDALKAIVIVERLVTDLNTQVGRLRQLIEQEREGVDE